MSDPMGPRGYLKLRPAGHQWPIPQDTSKELRSQRRVPSHIKESRESPVQDKLLVNEKFQEPTAVTSNGHLQRPIPTEKRRLRLCTALLHVGIRLGRLRMGIRLVAMEQLLRG